MSVYNRPMRGHYGVDRHWWPRIRAPSARNGLRIRRRFAFDVYTRARLQESGVKDFPTD